MTKSEKILTPETNGASPQSDDEGYVWPEGAAVTADVAVRSTAVPEAAEAPLPSLDELVKRIPPDVRETLDDLLRVKFVSVKRVQAASLKN